MERKLDGKRVAILATDGFEQSELLKPREALEEAGARCDVVSLKEGEIKGWLHGDWADTVAVDLTVDKASAADYDALLLPGGVINPDKLRMCEEAMAFVREFADAGKPIGAICHGPWSLVEIDAVDGRNVTSWPAIRTDIENAGGIWVDEEVVVDRGMVTSRKPDDIPAFNEKLIEEIGEGVHKRSQPTIAEVKEEMAREREASM
jgi:protease I